MKISDIGEFGLIHRVAPQFLDNLTDRMHGIGDDCAVLHQTDDQSLLVTTDLLIEDVHFLRQKISPFDLGCKSLAVNLSDIAAMGGEPLAAFLSIGLPKDITVEWLDQFFAGLHHLGEQTHSPLLGGDTTVSRDRVIINIAVLGRAQPGKIKYRSGARAGDVICVTGLLGDAAAGLRLIRGDFTEDRVAAFKSLMETHNKPRPHLEEGKWLAARHAVHAMLDVSDGIDSDIKRIMEQSKVGARIDIEKLPVSTMLARACRVFHWNEYEMAATGGEDYCLLFTASDNDYEKLAADFTLQFGRPLYKIGVIEKEQRLLYLRHNKKINLNPHGWDHFK